MLLGWRSSYRQSIRSTCSTKTVQGRVLILIIVIPTINIIDIRAKTRVSDIIIIYVSWNQCMVYNITSASIIIHNHWEVTSVVNNSSKFKTWVLLCHMWKILCFKCDVISLIFNHWLTVYLFVITNKVHQLDGNNNIAKLYRAELHQLFSIGLHQQTDKYLQQHTWGKSSLLWKSSCFELGRASLNSPLFLIRKHDTDMYSRGQLEAVSLLNPISSW